MGRCKVLLAGVGLAIALAGCGSRKEGAHEAPATTPASSADTAAAAAPARAGVEAKAPAPGPFEYATRVGLAAWDRTSKLRAALPDSTLRSGDPVMLVWVANPPTWTEARVAARTAVAWSLGGGVPVEGPSYDLDLVGQGEEVGMAFAIAGQVAGVRIEDGIARADLDGDGVAEAFTSCASSEGLHLSIWSGKPRQGTPRWHRYVYLAYDLDPNCTDDETRDL